MFICLLCLTILLMPNHSQAKELPTLKIGSSSGYKDEILTIPITLENNPGFSYIGAKIRYDATKLEYVNSKLLAFKSAGMRGIEINSYKTITLYALTIDDKLFEENGKIGEIQFKVLSEEEEEVPIEVTIDNFGKGEGDAIEIKKEDGVIQVKSHGTIDKQEDLSKEIDEKAEDITWKSSNEDIAEVDEKGNVVFHDEGEVTIEAVDKDGKTVYKKEYKVDDGKKVNEEEKEEKETKETSKKNQSSYILGGVILLVIILLLFILYKKKKSKN